MTRVRRDQGTCKDQNSVASQQPRAAGPARPKEYFVPRDGIDREVITADLCLYLGNDTIVRPGNFENPRTHQTQQGYYISYSFKAPTTATIADLKADSAKWDAERKNQISTSTTGFPGYYRDSDTRQSRLHCGPTSESSTSVQSDGEIYDVPHIPRPDNSDIDSFSDSSDGVEDPTIEESPEYGSGH